MIFPKNSMKFRRMHSQGFAALLMSLDSPDVVKPAAGLNLQSEAERQRDILNISLLFQLPLRSRLPAEYLFFEVHFLSRNPSFPVFRCLLYFTVSSRSCSAQSDMLSCCCCKAPIFTALERKSSGSQIAGCSLC